MTEEIKTGSEVVFAMKPATKEKIKDVARLASSIGVSYFVGAVCGGLLAWLAPGTSKVNKLTLGIGGYMASVAASNKLANIFVDEFIGNLMDCIPDKDEE